MSRGLSFFTGKGSPGFFLCFFVTVAACFFGGENVENLIPYLSFMVMSAALFLPSHRLILLKVNLGLLLGLCVMLELHLALDHFHYRYVWLYSAPDLKLYLKLANLWGGEEGTLLCFAVLLSGFALRLHRYSGWTVSGVILLAFPFIGGLLIWHPFEMTSVEQLAHAPYQGMNAHLTKFWMAIHPPLIFLTYLLLLVPAGAAAEALIKGRGPWKEIALRYSRWAWVVLSAGLISGMWWAYEDYFYGQIWHWDPVQTAAFVVWCWLTAYLHGLRVYHPQGAYARSLPFLSLLTGSAALMSMLVTRNGELVSSHRYLGETSVILLAALAAVLLFMAFGALVISFRRRIKRKGQLTESRLMIQIAIWGFFALGLMGCYVLGEAYVRAVLQIPKDKPPIFFALIANVSSADFVSLLKQQHLRWTVDNFSMNALLVPVVFLVALIGGHRFLPLNGFWWRVMMTLLAAGGSFFLAEYIQPLEYFYDGTGVTSSQTRRNFYQLNLVLGGVIYFSLSSLLYSLPIGVVRGREKAYFNYIAPVGLIHMGVMVGLFAALCATILDRNIIRKVTFPDAYGQSLKISDELRIRISRPQEMTGSAGSFSSQAQSGFRAITGVDLLVKGDRGEVLLDQGQTLYQDDRRPLVGDMGPIRQYCEAVDYRFARMTRSKSHMLNPYIYRGLSYDLQIWLPAVAYREEKGRGSDMISTAPTNTASYNIVIKKFPLMTWLWVGLGLSLLAGLYYALFSNKPGKKQS